MAEEKRVSVSMAEWERTYALTDSELTLLDDVRPEVGGLKKAEVDESDPIDESYAVEVPEEMVSREELKNKERLRSRIQTLEGVKKDCNKMIERMDEIVEMKQTLVDRIDTIYAESSHLIKKQKLLHIISSEVENIFKHFLTQERVFYYNSMLKMSASDQLSRSNIDSLLE